MSVSDLTEEHSISFDFLSGQGDNDNHLFTLDGTHLKFAPPYIPSIPNADSDQLVFTQTLNSLGFGFEASDIETISFDDDHVFYIVSDVPQSEHCFV